MPKFKNVASFGDVDSPGVGVVGSGDVVEVSAAVAELFIAQPGVWELIEEGSGGE